MSIYLRKEDGSRVSVSMRLGLDVLGTAGNTATIKIMPEDKAYDKARMDQDAHRIFDVLLQYLPSQTFTKLLEIFETSNELDGIRPNSQEKT